MSVVYVLTEAFSQCYFGAISLQLLIPNFLKIWVGFLFMIALCMNLISWWSCWGGQLKFGSIFWSCLPRRSHLKILLGLISLILSFSCQGSFHFVLYRVQYRSQQLRLTLNISFSPCFEVHEFFIYFCL